MQTLHLPALRLPTLSTLFMVGGLAYMFALTGLHNHATSHELMQMFIFFVFFYAAHSFVALFMKIVTTNSATHHASIVCAMRAFKTLTVVFAVVAVIHIILTALFGLNLNSLFAEKILLLKFTGVNLGISNPSVFSFEYSKTLFLTAIVGYPVATVLVYGALAIANKR